MQAIRAAYERLGGAVEDLRRVREQKREINALQARVQSFEQSASWLLTAPLRAAGTLLKSTRRTGAWIGIVLSALAHTVAGARTYDTARCPRCIR